MRIFTITFFLGLAIALVASVLVFDPDLTKTRGLVASISTEKTEQNQSNGSDRNGNAAKTSSEEIATAKRQTKAYDSCMRILPDCWQNHKRICSCVSSTVEKSFNEEDWSNFSHIQISDNGFSISLPKQSAQSTASKFNAAIGSCRQ